MKKRCRFCLGILGCIFIFLAGSWAQEKFNLGADLFNQNHLEEGLKRYAPTRMQWLARELNGRNVYSGERALRLLSYEVSYSAVDDYIKARVYYKQGAEYERVKSAIQVVRKHVSNRAEYYQWDSWVKVRLEFLKLSNMISDEMLKDADPEFVLKAEAAIQVADIEPTEIYEWKGRGEPKLIKSD